MVTQSVKTENLLQMFDGSKGTRQNDAVEQTDFSQSMEKAEKTYQKTTDDSGQNDKVEELFTEQDSESQELELDLQPENKVAMEMIANLFVMQNQNLADVMPKPEQMGDVQKEFLSQIAANLNISTEELEGFLKQFNLEPVDLTEPENLMKLFMEVKDVKNAGELLTNPELANALKDLTKTVQEFVPVQTVEQDMTTVTETVSRQTAETVDMPNQNLNGDMQQQQQSGQETGKQAFEQAEVPVEAKVQTVPVRQMNVMQNQIQELLAERVGSDTSEQILEQVLQQVKTTMKQDVTSIQMQLYPEHLGKVSIEVVSKNGVMTAHIATENESAKAALESQINVLKETFEAQGLKVESVEVMVSAKGFDQNQDTGKQSGQGTEKGAKRRRTFLETTEETEESTKEDDLKETLGNTVSYIA